MRCYSMMVLSYLAVVLLSFSLLGPVSPLRLESVEVCSSSVLHPGLSYQRSDLLLPVVLLGVSLAVVSPEESV